MEPDGLVSAVHAIRSATNVPLQTCIQGGTGRVATYGVGVAFGVAVAIIQLQSVLEHKLEQGVRIRQGALGITGDLEVTNAKQAVLECHHIVFSGRNVARQYIFDILGQDNSRRRFV